MPCLAVIEPASRKLCGPPPGLVLSPAIFSKLPTSANHLSQALVSNDQDIMVNSKILQQIHAYTTYSYGQLWMLYMAGKFHNHDWSQQHLCHGYHFR